MQAMQSSHLNGIEYEEQSRTLTIQFVNGAMYSYANVPADVYWALKQQSSPGSYFHAKIKGRYESTLLVAGDAKKRDK